MTAPDRADHLDERGLPPGHPFRDAWEVTPREVRERLNAGEDLLLIDCRTRQEHAIARVEEALLVPMHEVSQRTQELVEQNHRPIVVMCHHGQRSLQVTAYLRQCGLTDVRSMAGGIDLWSVDVDGSVPRY